MEYRIASSHDILARIGEDPCHQIYRLLFQAIARNVNIGNVLFLLHHKWLTQLKKVRRSDIRFLLIRA